VFQRDYILRLVEQLAKTLGSVVALKKAKRYDEAERGVAEAAKNLVGLDVATLLALPVEHIVTLLSPGSSLDAGKCIVVAELLYEHGELKELQGEDGTAYDTRVRALCLLLEVSGRESLERIPDSERYLRRIEALVDTLSAYPPVPAVQEKLIFHHERQGDFSAAEDVLFELVDAGDENIIAPGIELYERLLAKDDDALNRGRLPRDEVEDGLAQLRARLARMV
jgi:hypothetical protein